MLTIEKESSKIISARLQRLFISNIARRYPGKSLASQLENRITAGCVKRG